MKLYYLANIRLPTEKAHGAQVMKTCEAFALAGHEVMLVVPRRLTPIKDDPFSYYGVTKTFSIRRLPVLDTVHFGRVGFFLETIIFSVVASMYLLFVRADVLYSRDELPLWVVSFIKHNLVWESHAGTTGNVVRWLLRVCTSVVAISEGIKSYYVNLGVPPQKIHVAHDGIDLKPFETFVEKKDARKKLGLTTSLPVVMYVGRLDGWKGVEVLLQASREFIGRAQVVIIGGEPLQVTRFRQKFPHVIFLGFLPYRNIASYLAAADVLVLPNTATDDVSRLYTSPMKLFAYMAAGKPIVSSDVPSIREILNEKNAFFFKADIAQSLANTLTEVLSNPDMALSVAAVAKKDVVQYTWDARALGIMEHITHPSWVKDESYYNRESEQYSSRRYPATLRTYTQFFFMRRLSITKSFVRQYLGSGKTGLSLLDIGCADGVVMQAVHDVFPTQIHSYVGIDTAPEMVKVAAKQVSISNAEFFVRDHYAPTKQFDVILETGVINYSHFETDLAYVYEHLTQAGVYVLSVAGTNSLLNKLKGEGGFRDFRSYTEYETLLRERFVIRQVRGCGFFVPFLWRLPALARVVQSVVDRVAGVLVPGLCHEKVYLLQKK